MDENELAIVGWVIKTNSSVKALYRQFHQRAWTDNIDHATLLKTKETAEAVIREWGFTATAVKAGF